MTQPITVVDAFADTPFAGNPAAVCVLPGPASEEWMRLVAQELNLSETAFLHPVAEGYRLRWFTPTVEVDLCGHATLASAHVLWQDGWLPPHGTARFHTRSGVLTARRDDGRIVLDFPATPAIQAPAPAELLRALGVPRAEWTGKSRFDWLVELDGEAAVRALDPDFGALRGLAVRGVIVTAAAEPGRPADFVSRFFAPGAGVDEDPVTGSAHATLAPFWAGRLERAVLVGYQASARGGTVHCEVTGDRVLLGGTAVTIWRGMLA